MSEANPSQSFGPESAEKIAQRKIHGAVRQILANELGLTGSNLAAFVQSAVRQRINEEMKRIDAEIKTFLSPERMEAALARHIKESASDVWNRCFKTEVMQRAVVQEIEAEFRAKARQFIDESIRVRADVNPSAPVWRKIIT